MKKIITMVGTSIFENYLEDEKNDSEFKNYMKDLKDKKLSEWKSEEDMVSQLKVKLNNWIKNSPEKELINACAEIKSITKIYEEVRDEIGVYFLTSDTILSNLALEVITENWEKFKDISKFKNYPESSEKAVVGGLQVKDRNKFIQEGMVNLIKRIYDIVEDYWDNVIINITAGYKSTLPFLTILAQINRCPLYYIFEDTDALIKIPYVPLSINWKVFNENESFFFDLEVEDIKELPTGLELRNEVESLVEKADNLVSLNPLGVTLWEKYKESFDIFKISDEVKRYYEEKKDRQSIIIKSLKELKRRLKENPQDPDLKHLLQHVNLPENWYTFKHKENNLQVRILYKADKYKTRYGRDDIKIYIGLIAIGSDVHNAESEYVKFWKENTQKVNNPKGYSPFKIEKEGEL